REVPRYERGAAGADRGERGGRVARCEREVGRALGCKGAIVERVDADPAALVLLFGEAEALDAADAGHRQKAVRQRLLDRRLDPARGRRRSDDEVGTYLMADEVEHR